MGEQWSDPFGYFLWCKPDAVAFAVSKPEPIAIGEPGSFAFAFAISKPVSFAVGQPDACRTLVRRKPYACSGID